MEAEEVQSGHHRLNSEGLRSSISSLVPSTTGAASAMRPRSSSRREDFALRQHFEVTRSRPEKDDNVEDNDPYLPKVNDSVGLVRSIYLVKKEARKLEATKQLLGCRM